MLVDPLPYSLHSSAVAVHDALIACVPLCAFVGTMQIYARFNRRYTSNSLTASAAASVVAEECFGSIRTVRLRLHPVDLNGRTRCCSSHCCV
jgi:hypothetical protein